jgi:hypothetical protein
MAKHSRRNNQSLRCQSQPGSTSFYRSGDQLWRQQYFTSGYGYDANIDAKSLTVAKDNEPFHNTNLSPGVC